MSRTSITFSVVMAVVLGASALCLAEDIEKARQLNEQAIEAYKGKNYIEAVDLWLQACEYAAADQLPKLHKNLGLALKKLGKMPEAWYYLDAFRNESPEKDEAVEEALVEVEEKLAGKSIKVRIVTKPAGATVILPPGDRMHQLKGPLSWWFEPGKYNLLASLEGYLDARETIEVTQDGSKVFTLYLVKGNVTGELRLEGEPAGSVVLVDGTEVGKLPFEGEFSVGDHAVTVRFPNGTTWTRNVTLNRGEKVVHTAIMPAAPVEKPVEPQPPEGGDKPAAAQGGDHTLAWVALGVGGALVATGGVFTYLAYDRFGDYDANRDTADEMLEDGDDPDDIAEWINDEDDKVAADVSQDQWIFVTCYAVGGAAVAAGVVMLLLDDGAGTDGPAVSVVPLLSPETTGLSFSASF